MTGDAEPTPGEAERARLAIAAGATVLLAAIVGIVLATGGGSDEPGIANECITSWNDDPIAPLQDGTHAYAAHGYRETLVTRLDDDGNVLDTEDGAVPPGEPDARCAVIFAAPQVDFEPDFGVRVENEQGWVGLVLAEKLEVGEIEAMQQQAVAVANARLLPDGTLEPN